MDASCRQLHSAAQTGFAALPDDLVARILTLVDHNDRVQAEQVCKTWRRLLSQV